MLNTEALAAALADRYSIERLIGEGGMAKVFLARDLRHNRRVALKALRPDLGAVVGVDRFQSEIQVTANLQHPNLLPLFDSGAAGEMLFYVMPYIEGESLRARLEREKQLPVDEAVRIASAIAGALDYAHRQGVVHRDLKPENILIQEGQPLVADFGIALAISNAGGARITQTGISLGTPQYMSPEQATGDRAVDGRTDIYSLGAVTYEMLTGEPPHVGATSRAVIARVLTERPRSIRATRSNVPEHVEAAVDQALEKVPADRWPTARAFAEALTGARYVSRSSGVGLRSERGVAAAAKRKREVAAWTFVAGLTIATAALGFRAMQPIAMPEAAEFEVVLPDSLQIPIARSAASIAISRDGRTLVFVGQRGLDAPRLYLRHLGDRFVQEIRGTDSARSPILSPNGEEVLFTSGKLAPRTTIERISIAGGTSRTFADSGARNGQISWREGNQVVMVGPGQSLVIVDAASGSRQVVVKADSLRREQIGFPDVLPGGKTALVAISKGRRLLDSVTIGAVTIPEGEITDLGIRGLFPRYSAAGGGHVVFGTREGSLYAIPFDASAVRVTGKPVLLADNVGAGAQGAMPLAVADNGTLAFIPGKLVNGQARPAIVSRSGVNRFFGAPSGFFFNPRVSPDGRQVAYTAGDALTSLTDLDRPDVWRVDAATGRAQRVTTDGASDRPLWSRDGTEIFFSKIPRDSDEYAIGLSAGAKPRLAFHGPGLLGTSDLGPRHGYAILEVGGTGSRSAAADLWMAPMDSMNSARPFATESYAEGMPRISPDGRLVAYSSFRTGTGEIYVRSLVGSGEETRISSGGGIDPAWSHDGHELFFRAPTKMMAARIETSPKVRLVSMSELFSLEGYLTSPTRTVYDVFPNGDFLMLATRVDTGRVHTPLVVRLNWPSVLAERGERKR